jgi:hypothetical protein
MSAAERLATEHRERIERFRRDADRVRDVEVTRIAIDILGVQPDDVARALRGHLTRDDENEDIGPGGPPDTGRART